MMLPDRTVRVLAPASALLAGLLMATPLLLPMTAQAQRGKRNASTASAPAQARGGQVGSAPILTVGNEVIPAREFDYIYRKNNASAQDAYSKANLEEYLRLYTNFRLKVLDARRMGLDTTAAFRQELEGYRRQLAQPYLTEKSVTDRLVKEAYERMRQEIRASHILIRVDPTAAPADTMRALTQIRALRARAMGGEDFNKLAREASQDPSAAQNGGDLGYFSALQMVYPFETAAYTTPVGSVSEPFRTSFGYHILRVDDKRPNQGQVRVAHIMIRANPGMPAEDSLAALEKIRQIHQRVTSGRESFRDLALAFSDDKNSAEQGGTLPPFSAGQLVPTFEQAAFALRDTGAISAPVMTPFGFHVIKLLERKPLERYEELEPQLKTRVSRDSRAELNRAVLLTRLRRDNNLVEQPKALEAALSRADTNLPRGRWRYRRADKALSQTLFTIAGQPTRIEDFFEHLERNQQAGLTGDPRQIMRRAYTQYLEERLLAYEEANLAAKYEDFRMLYNEYRDGILLFSLMDQKVWTKAMEDTAGLRTYFEANRDKYRYTQRADAIVITAADQASLDRARTRLKEGNYRTAEQPPVPLKFERNQVPTGQGIEALLVTVVAQMRNDPDLLLTVTGFAEPGERANIGRARAQALRDSLVGRGIAANRIDARDGGTDRRSKARADARRLELSYRTRSVRALERELNEGAPLSVQIVEGKFQRGENDALDQIANWQAGTRHTLPAAGTPPRLTHIEIRNVEAPRNKTLDEARGLVISDYQQALDDAWVQELRQRYPVKVNQAELDRLVSQR